MFHLGHLITDAISCSQDGRLRIIQDIITSDKRDRYLFSTTKALGDSDIIN
jgi:hypothetical protein